LGAATSYCDFFSSVLELELAPLDGWAEELELAPLEG
jgi:hypothetical protein